MHAHEHAHALSRALTLCKFLYLTSGVSPLRVLANVPADCCGSDASDAPYRRLARALVRQAREVGYSVDELLAAHVRAVQHETTQHALR